MGMWVKVDDSRVQDLESGNVFAVKASDDERKVRSWNVIHHAAKQAAANNVLGAGYKTEAEAQGALAELLSELGIEPARIQPPVTPEEVAETEEEKAQ